MRIASILALALVLFSGWMIDSCILEGVECCGGGK